MLQLPAAPAPAAESRAGGLCLFAQRAVWAEQHKEGRESRSHVGEKDFQSQQTHPKREEGGKRYISFLTFFKINAGPGGGGRTCFPRLDGVEKPGWVHSPPSAQAPSRPQVSNWVPRARGAGGCLRHRGLRSFPSRGPRAVGHARGCSSPSRFGEPPPPAPSELSLRPQRNAQMDFETPATCGRSWEQAKPAFCYFP